MKRYRIRPTREVGIAAHEHKDGEWVRADVAQALYDALVHIRHNAGKSGANMGFALDHADEALSLADGETE